MSSRHLPRAPLVYVLAQINFDPIDNLEEQIPAITEILGNGPNQYEKPEKQQVYSFTISSKEPTISKESRWVFSNTKKDNSVLIMKNAITFCVSDYDVFETFIDDSFKTLESLSSNLFPPQHQFKKASIRYIDLLLELDQIPAKQFINPSFFTSGDWPRENSIREQYNLELSQEDVFIQIILFTSKYLKTFPPQIVPPGLKTVYEELNDSMIILDSTYYQKIEEKCNFEDIKSIFPKLHKISHQYFTGKIIAPKALEIWRTENVNDN